MSDDGRTLSDDDGGDLFDSDSEDQTSEVELSMEMPSLSMDSLYIGPPRPTENYDGDELSSDQSGACEFEVDEGAVGSLVQPMQLIDESEEQELEGLENNSLRFETNDSRPNDQEDDEKSSTNGDEEDVVAKRAPVATHRESPRVLPETIAQHDSDDKKELDDDDQHIPGQEAHRDDVCVPSSQTNIQNLTTLTDAINSSEDSDSRSAQSLAPTQSHIDPEQPTDVATEPEEQQTEAISTPDTGTKLSPRESREQHTGIAYSQSSDLLKSTLNVPVYTVDSLFPVVYEKDAPPAPQSRSDQVVSLSNSPSYVQASLNRRKQQTGSNPDKGIASRLAGLQCQLDAARSELSNATRTFKLQLSMAQADNKKLSQRSTCLKNRLSVATTDLQRTGTELAKLKTENELYASKLPRLQAELLEETSLVDESQAQSVQTQLALTQLKARSHVLQTRNLALETQNNKLTQELRECTQHLKRKAATLQQQGEKMGKMESDMSDLKTTHEHEKLEWKSRMTCAVQRCERENVKFAAEWEAKERKELREAKERADKAVKKWQTAESMAAKLEDHLKHHKHELASANDSNVRRIKEVRTLESLLRKAHCTEATLRNDLAACKSKLRTFQEEKRRQMTRRTAAPTRRRRLEHQIPIELFLPLTDESDDEADNQVHKCCSHCNETFEPASPIACTECPVLHDQLSQLRNELRRVRALHSAELHAQASVLDAMLHQKRQVAVPSPY